MSKLFRIGISFIVFGVIILCTNSCGIFTSENPEEYEYEYENDPEPFETEPNISVINEDIIVTEPTTVIQEPEFEIEPPVTPLGNVFSASGTIKSDTDKLIKLHIDWKAHQIGGSEYVHLDLSVYLDCYAITVGERTNSTLTVNDEKIEFSTPMITNENNSMTSIEIHKRNMQIHNPVSEEIKAIDIEAAYYFGGSYGGESIGWIEVSGVIELSDDGSQISENTINETPETETENETNETTETETENETNETTEMENETPETVKNPFAPELPDDPFKPVEE